MATLRFIAAVVVLASAGSVGVLTGCGGSLLNAAEVRDVEADANIDHDTGAGAVVDGSIGDAGPAPRCEGSAPSGDGGSDGATGEAGADPDAPLPGCAPVTTGCRGAASCGANSAPMPVACADGTSYEEYCRSRTQCSAGPAFMLGEAGSFYCYSCNP